MKRTGKILLCLALALALCLALLPGAARAASGTVIQGDSCGTNVRYTAYDTGELVISGTGVVEHISDWDGGTIIYEVTCGDGEDTWLEDRGLPITKLTIQQGVTGIADYAFADFGSLESVTIASSVKSIGAHAFEDCSSLTGVTIPSAVTHIGNSAFSGCFALAKLTIPEGVTSIGNSAFWSCRALTKLTIPASMKRIESNAFYDCGSLTGVYISDLAAWCGIDFGEEQYGEGNPLVTAHKLYLNGSLVTKLTIPSGVKSIADDAFHGCSTLTSVTIPSSVTSIGDGAFFDCSTIKDVYYQGSEYDGRLLKKAIQNDNEDDGYRNEALVDAAWHYSEPIEAGWQLCGDRVIWKYDSSARKLTIKGSGPMWDDDDYEGSDVPWADCRGKMVSVEIQKGVTSIGSYAFQDCSKLSSVTIPAGVTSIGDSAFSGCSALTSVTIPASIKRFGYEAFYDCEALTGVHISDLAAWCGIDFGDSSGNPLRYAHKLYLNGSLVTKLTIPSGVKSIKANAFYGCGWLTGVTIPSGVTSIGDAAFEDCSALTSVTIPSSVKSIGSYAFESCSSMTKITIPKAVKSIGSAAFQYCESLQTVIFSGTPEEIAGDAFWSVNARAFYPADGGWWKEDRLDYGGTLSWVSYHTLYTVKYNANGGEGAPAATVKADGETYRLSGDEPVRDRYVFKGWATAAKAGKAKYQPGGSYTADANVSFYAVWAPLAGEITGSSHSSAGAPIVKWKALTGAASYDVFRSTTGEDGSYKLLDSATGKSYTDASAAAGKCYYYKVRGVTEAGVKGELSEPVAIYAKPNAPTLTASVKADGRPTLSWKAVTGASAYQVWRKSAAKGSSYKLIVTMSGRSYIDENAAVGMSYIYRVRAVTEDGTKGKYAVSPKLKCTLASPRVDVGANEKGKPTLSWYTVDGAVKYEIWRSTTGKAGSFKKFATVTGTSWTNAKAALGKTFWYKVKAVASDGTKSGFSKVCRQKVVPAAPQVTGSFSTKGKPVLTWKTVKGAAKYEIWRAEQTSGKFVRVKTGTAKKYTDTKATVGKTYIYRVRAVMEDGTKGVYSYEIYITARPTAPKLTGELNAKGKPVLSWKPVDGAAEYQIWRSTTGEPGSFELAKTVTGTSWTHSKAKSGKTYYYVVVAVSESGAESGYSDIITLTAK